MVQRYTGFLFADRRPTAFEILAAQFLDNYSLEIIYSWKPLAGDRGPFDTALPEQRVGA